MVKAGIIGAAGYTGGEILRLLLEHPHTEVAFAHSNSNGGRPVYEVHADLYGCTNLHFTGNYPTGADVLFLCGGHGEGYRFLKEHTVPAATRVIDLSQDFRLAANAYAFEREFIYGLPEVNYAKIRRAKSIANPGCFATAIELALLPAVAAGLLQHDVIINGITGSTGAGYAPTVSTHYSNRAHNVANYKVFNHQHLAEIQEMLFSGNSGPHLVFVPQRGPFTRGILVNCIFKTGVNTEELMEIYRTYYAQAAFTHVCGGEISLKQVAGTNKCVIGLQQQQGYAVATAIIDNLLKGAAGQAVQNMNIMYGWPEDAGLRLKATVF